MKKKHLPTELKIARCVQVETAGFAAANASIAVRQDVEALAVQAEF